MLVMSLYKSDYLPITQFLTLKSCEKIMSQQSYNIVIVKINCIKKKYHLTKRIRQSQLPSGQLIESSPGTDSTTRATN